MELTWKDTIRIIMSAFDLTQEKLAPYLNVSASQVSRYLSGESNPTLTPDFVYETLFDPTNERSRAHKNTRYLYYSLLEAIKNEGFYDAMKDIWEDEYRKEAYKPFIEAFLGRTKKNKKSQKKSPRKKGETLSPESKSDGNKVFLDDGKDAEINDDIVAFERNRSIFLDVTRNSGVMEIINRKPAVMYREDSAKLLIFVEQLEQFLPARNFIEQNYSDAEQHILLCMKSFSSTLHLEALSIESTLISRFGNEDETAFIDMEEEETSVSAERASCLPEIPELTPELIREAADPVGLLECAISEWSTFRNKMNCLYKIIHDGFEQ